MLKIVKNQEGVILLTVLAAIGLVIPLIYAGLEQRQFQIHRVRNEINMQEAYRISCSMLDQVKVTLSRDGAASDSDHLLEIWSQPIPLHGIENAHVVAYIKDTNRLWNLNSLVHENGQVDPHMRQIFGAYFSRKGLDEDLLDAVIDWIDPDDLVSGLGGAEQSYYENATINFNIKNAPLASLAELKLLRGWSAETIESIQSSFTVSPSCRNGQININTAGKDALLLLNDLWTDREVEAIMYKRLQKPFQTANEILSVPEIQALPFSTQFLTVSSNCFVVQIVAKVDNIRGILNAAFVRDKGNVVMEWVRWNK